MRKGGDEAGAPEGRLGEFVHGGRARREGAAAFGAFAGGAHFLLDPANTEWLSERAGFTSVRRADGGVDWIAPAWFPVRRVSDEELEANEIEFRMRVDAVLDGRVDAREAERVRAEYRERREREKARRAGEAG